MKEIFHSYLYDGKGSYIIAHELSDRKIPTLKNRVWSPQHILKILKNEKYVGDLKQWKVYTPNVFSPKAVTNHGDNPNAPIIYIRDHHEPIISRELWDSTQEELIRRSHLVREGSKHSRSYWYSGKVECGKCHYSYIVTGSATNPNRRLGCRNRQLYGKNDRVAPNGEHTGCDNSTVDERVINKAMEVLFLNMRELRPSIEQEMLFEIQEIQKVRKTVDVTPLKEEIAKLQQKKRKAIDLMLEELITKDDLKQQTEFYDSEINRITEEISANQNIGAIHQKQIDGINAAIERMRKMSDCNVDNTAVYKEMVDKIIVPEYGFLNVYLNGIPFSFQLAYTVKKAPTLGIYEIIIDSCEIIS